MAYASLADFLEELHSCGQLSRVSAEVDGELEIAEITRRVAAQRGPALLFEHVRGSSMAVITNLLGTDTRVCRALSIDSLDDIFTRTESLIARHTPQNWFDRLKTLGDDGGAGKFRPKTVKSAPCQQVVRLGRDVDLAHLPLVKQWPGESGRSITGGRVMSIDRREQVPSVTVCPLVSLDANRLAVIDGGSSGFARHLADYRAVNEKMPVAVVSGGDPAGAIAAALDLPDGVDPLHMAGLLRTQAVEVVKCRTHALEVPGDADLVIEGYVDPEAPGVEVTSTVTGGIHYHSMRAAPVIHVTALTHRSHPIVPMLIDSGELSELGSLGKARERMLLPAVQKIAPEVVDLHLPAFGGRDRYAFVSIRKTFAFQARGVASALWGSAALRFTKFVVVLDEQVDVCDSQRVLAEIGANVMPERDVFTYDGPASAAESGGCEMMLGRYLGIDATAKIAGERSRGSPPRLAASAETGQLVSSRWAEYKLDIADSGR